MSSSIAPVTAVETSQIEAIAEIPVDGDLDPNSARGRRGWVGFLQIAAIIAVVGLAVGFSREGSTAGDTSASVPAPMAPAAVAPVPAVAAPAGPGAVPAPVNVLVPQLTRSTLSVDATGSVTVRNRVQLVPEVSGRVVDIAQALRAGGSFAAGEQLLVIDPAEFRLALDQANADLAVARARLQLAEAEAEAARANYALLRPGKPVPPLVARAPQIEQGRAEVSAAEARVAVAALELSRTRFSLPFAGRITSSLAEVGQVLRDGQSFGEAFAEEALEVAVAMTQDDLERLAPVIGRTAVVRANGVERTAIVERVSAELDARTRFARVYLGFSGPAGLAPGTFVEVTVAGPELANTYLLPGSAEQMNGRFWVADQGQLRRVSPRILGRTPAGLLVEAFDAGDGVVLGAVPGGREGLAVRPVSPDA